MIPGVGVIRFAALNGMGSELPYMYLNQSKRNASMYSIPTPVVTLVFLGNGSFVSDNLGFTVTNETLTSSSHTYPAIKGPRNGVDSLQYVKYINNSGPSFSVGSVLSTAKETDLNLTSVAAGDYYLHPTFEFYSISMAFQSRSRVPPGYTVHIHLLEELTAPICAVKSISPQSIDFKSSWQKLLLS